jgi:hypothetical protein
MSGRDALRLDIRPAKEAAVSRVPRWGHGSKRRIKLIRWNPYQIAGLIVLAFALMALGFVLARMLASLEAHEHHEQEDLLIRRGSYQSTT